ncbi:MAG: DUF3341 domain-containing protein [Planctomycetes bacterium]|nr:DUF3341 domain-containing protein [Planctomycetota bacterium]
MSQTYVVAYFEHEDDILGATRKSRESGHTIVDVFTPYAVHGMDEAMGLRFSRMTWVCFIFGMLGALGAVFGQMYITMVDWPAVIGGKPLNSLPAYIPITFECAVLFGGLGSIVVLFARSKLFPFKKPDFLLPSVTNDKFALVLKADSATITAKDLQPFFADFGATHIEERLEDTLTVAEGAPGSGPVHQTETTHH